jgi:hypothetical protein
MNRRFLIGGSLITIFGIILLFLSGAMENGIPIHTILYGPERRSLFILVTLVGLLIIFTGIFKKQLK